MKNERDIAIAMEKKNETECEITDLKSEIQDLKEENSLLINEKNNKIALFEQLKSQTENEIQQLRRENNANNANIQQLQQENSNLRSENKHLKDHAISFIRETGAITVSNEVLGSGGWGTVYTGNFYGTEVAVKKYHQIILSPYNQKLLGREINIASQCRHPNLLQFLCATKNDKGQLLIVTELMDMSLRKLLEQRASATSCLDRHEVTRISVDVARGCLYLHSKKPYPIIHRDVSSANVLLQIESDGIVRAKISDYGSANFMQICNTANPGAALYAAPEASRGQQDAKVINSKTYSQT